MNIFKRLVFSLLRIWLGYEWLMAGIEKVGSPVWTGAQAGTAINGFLKGAVAKATGDHPAVQAWYASFLTNYAIPHAKLLSFLVVWGEILTGIALILGALTGFALLVGAFMNLNYMLAGSTSTNPNLFTVSMILLFVGTAVVAYMGVDRLVAPYVEPFWRRVRRSLGMSPT